MKKFNINKIAYDALLLSVLVVCSWISIPFGASPITMQVFGVILILLLAPGVDSIIIILLYALMGSLGLPVFNGGTSGIASLTYGFIIGFVASSVVIYIYILLFQRKRSEKLFDIIIKCLIFELVIYICGITYFTIISETKSFIGWLIYFLPYMGLDIIKCIFAILIYTKLFPILKNLSKQNASDNNDNQNNNN